MDIPRTAVASARKRQRIWAGCGVIAGVVLLTQFIQHLKPAVPTVDRNVVLIDTVRRGDMLREVRGLGTLVPEDIRWIAARTDGRVDHIVIRPGAVVQKNSVILVLTNPAVEQAAADAESKLKAAEAELVNQRVQLQRNELEAEASAASVHADWEQDRLKSEVNEALNRRGLISTLDFKVSKVVAEQAEIRDKIEQKKLAFMKDSITPQLAVKEAEIVQARLQAQLRRADLASLQVVAGMEGILEVLPVEEGAQVQAGTNLARVADPAKLKAEIQIAETQARDVQIGEPALIDTRNGTVAGRVSRIDPSVQNGTVKVDVSLTGALPRGARPDLSVDGTIELERIADVVYMGRPALGQELSTVGLFKLDPDARYADRTQVTLGRSSVNVIEVRSGLKPGDQIILSEMSRWDGVNRIRLN